MSLDAGVAALLNPRGVVLVGVSEDPGKMAGNPMRALASSGFAGGAYPVNPNRDTIGGRRAYRSVDDIDGPADVALIVTPRQGVIEAVEACGRKGVRAAVVISSGFAETGAEGAALQAQLLAAARACGVRVVGPNCTGYFTGVADLPLGTSAAFLTGRYRKGALAFITQSGAIGTAMLTRAHERGLGPSLWFSTGNEMDLTVADFMAAGVADDNTRALVLYLEGVRDTPPFAKAARSALEAGKPVIAIKVGRSDLGAEKAQAHTGALIGSDDCYTGFFRQHGVIRVDSIDDLLPVAALFQSRRRWGKGRVGVISVSGGLAAYAADGLSQAKLELAELSAETLRRLDATSVFSTPGNPFDPAGQVTSNPQIMVESVQAFLDDPDVDVLVVLLPFGVHILRVVPPVVAEAARNTDKMICFVRWMPADYGRDATDALAAFDVPVFESIDECVTALAARDRYERERPAILAATARASQRQPAPELDAEGPLLETESRALLARYGLPSAPEAVARSAEEAVAIARRLGGPVALKILSRDIPHKTEAGGVLLGLSEDDAIHAGHERLIENARAFDPGAHIEGVLVQRMAQEGIEVILGAMHEPGFGPVIMAGVGGVLAEAISKTAVRPAPLSAFDAEAMIDEAGLGALLASARRGRPSDRPALAEALLGLSRLMTDHGDRIVELDVNPLRVHLRGDGVTALDGLIVAPKPGSEP